MRSLVRLAVDSIIGSAVAEYNHTFWNASAKYPTRCSIDASDDTSLSYQAMFLYSFFTGFRIIAPKMIRNTHLSLIPPPQIHLNRNRTKSGPIVGPSIPCTRETTAIMPAITELRIR